MKKKVLLSAPILTRSGYGEMARLAYEALKTEPDVDLYINPTNWGQTGWLIDDSEQLKEIDAIISKTAQYAKEGGTFDVSIQCTIPNEWKRLAAVNIGYTAGIETNLISPAWLEPSQQMDKIIVISEHAKRGFAETEFEDQNKNRLRVTTDVDVVHFPFFDEQEEALDLELDYDKNFLAIAQWGGRKNLEQTVVDFVKEFKDEEVGLVIKTNISRDNTYDRLQCEQQLKNILQQTVGDDRKCKVYLLHGTLTDGELASLYRHPKIKAIVSTTHGEGYGLPLFEAACCELPVIATDWSGHLDFLQMTEDGEEKKMFGRVDYELKPIADSVVWKGVLEQGVSWAYPLSVSVRKRMREVLKDEQRYRARAKKLAKHLKETFTRENVYGKFVGVVNFLNTHDVIYSLSD